MPVGTIVRDVLSGIPSRDLVAARVNGKVVDLTRKLEHDASVEPVLADSPEGLEVIRHSTAHLMAMAVQSLYPGTQVTIGPVIEDGFFYDFAPAAPFTVEDLPKIEAKMRELVKADHKIQRTEVSREDAIRKFSAMGEKYKVEIIQGIPDDHVSIYSQGDWMDLCRGPHVPSTRYLKAFKLTSVAGAYWRGDEHNAMLSRIYGTAFAGKEALEEHLKLVELARQRDHRKLGREMGLYIFDPISPGSPFYLPKGVIIFNALVDYMRRLYRRYGYDEVVTPLIFKNELFNTSGHWENFRENMFLSPDPDSETHTIDTGPDGWHHGYGLKPMNCPGHTFVYRAEKRSYRDLPLRLAEFSRLHRAERSGTLHGLMRVRAMSQDDAHIFCREDQIEDEIALNLQMVRDVYGALGFERVEFKLATMPEQHLGTAEQWRDDRGKARQRNEAQRNRVRDKSEGRRLLRAQDRDLRVRRAQAQVAGRDDTARFQHARALRPDLHQQRRRRRTSRDDSSRDPGLARTLYRRADRAYRRRAALVARARAGAGAVAQRKGRELRQRSHRPAAGARDSAPTATSATRSSVSRFAKPNWPRCRI